MDLILYNIANIITDFVLFFYQWFKWPLAIYLFLQLCYWATMHNAKMCSKLIKKHDQNKIND